MPSKPHKGIEFDCVFRRRGNLRSAATDEGILITKNGKPVAELRPPASPRPKSPFGLHKGMMEITGNIVSPIDVK